MTSASSIDGAVTTERFDVLTAETTMTFFTRMEHWTAAVYGRAIGLTGHVTAGWSPDGIVLKPPPRVHVEFRVENLTSGNDFKDQAIWKIIDSKRFPLIAADMIALHRDERPNRYVATGQITLAGIARRREGECTVSRDGDRITFDGKLSIDVRDFGLRAQRLLIFSIEPQVTIHLHLVARAAASRA